MPGTRCCGVHTMHTETLQLIARLPERRPCAALPVRLASLFHHLAIVTTTAEAAVTEAFIWSLWVSHPNAAAERVLDLATGDIAAKRFDIADTRLTRLLQICPDSCTSAPILPRPGTSAARRVHPHMQGCPQRPQHPGRQALLTPRIRFRDAVPDRHVSNVIVQQKGHYVDARPLTAFP